MKTLLLIVLVWTITACSACEHKESNNIPELKEYVLPSDWKRTEAYDIEFHIPPNLIEKESRKLMPGSTIKYYGDENIWLVFTIQSKSVGSDRFAKERDFRVEQITVDGKQSEISTFTGKEMVNEAEGKIYVASFDVPQIQGNTKNLLMWAYSKSLEDRETVLKIFKSVRILKE